MKKEELIFIEQLIKSLKDSEKKLEKFYINKDVSNFNKTKKFILKIQKEIDNEIK
ncbi:hypothetical protein ACFLZF_00725 [Nanoarchaeota archaeon]